MPAKRFPLEPGGPERLEIEWTGAFKDFTVSLDGVVLGSFEDSKALKAGRSFTLEGGSVLKVQLGQWLLFPELILTLDGAAVPGSPGDPEQKVAGAANVIFVVAGLSVVIGLAALAFDIQFLRMLGAGGWSVLAGLVYAGLAFQVKKRQMWALALAVALYVVDGALSLAMSVQPGATPPVGGIIIRIVFTLMMARGFGAIRELESRPRSRRPTRPTPMKPRPAPPAAPPMTAARRKAVEDAPPTTQAIGGRRPTEIKTRSSTDAAASALRFVAFKCEITPKGLRVTSSRGAVREVAFGEIRSLLVRQLPPDPPWSSQLLLDAVPDGTNGAGEPIRILGTTVVNYHALPKGASTSRLENLRSFGSFLAAQNPSLSIDPETAHFLQGPKAPARFTTMVQFHEYDSRFGGG
jgi:hypothetical protein